MPGKKTTPEDRNRPPVAREFRDFERDYGGDAVNAHDDRMDSALHDNAARLDRANADHGDRQR